MEIEVIKAIDKVLTDIEEWGTFIAQAKQYVHRRNCKKVHDVNVRYARRLLARYKDNLNAKVDVEELERLYDEMFEEVVTNAVI